MKKIEFGDQEILFKFLDKRNLNRSQRAEIVRQINNGEKQDTDTEKRLKAFFKYKSDTIKEATKLSVDLKKEVQSLWRHIVKKNELSLIQSELFLSTIKDIKKKLK